MVQYLAAHGAELDRTQVVAETAERGPNGTVGGWLAAIKKITRLELLIALRLHARTAKLLSEGGESSSSPPRPSTLQEVTFEVADALPFGTLEAMVAKRSVRMQSKPF